jgi:hypothetical protein
VPSGEHLRAAKAALEELGFSVEEGARVKGLSGFEHRFDLLARRGARVICVSIAEANPLSLLAELAKGLDVEHEVVVAAEGGAPREAPEPARGRVKVVAFRSSEELAEELKRIAA